MYYTVIGDLLIKVVIMDGIKAAAITLFGVKIGGKYVITCLY
jgi:hypothetical protein